MSQVCELTGKRPAYGNSVSHANNKTRTRWMPNLRQKSYLIPELQQMISLRLSTRAIRTIDKLGGITPAIMAAGEKVLSDRLQRVKNRIYNARVKRTAAGKTTEGTQKKEAKAKHSRAEKPSGTPKAAKAAKAPKAAKATKAKKEK
jgi:large subunit ribosomal protein L28